MENMNENLELESEIEDEIPEEETSEKPVRGSAFRRQNDRKKKERRKKIIKIRRLDQIPDKHLFSVPLKYNPHKTKNKGKRRLRHGNYDPSYNYRAQEAQRIEAMEDDIKEFGVEE